MATVPAVLHTARLGNFRLGYLPADLRRLRDTYVHVTVGGAPARVRYDSLSIHDALNAQPNTCRLTLDGTTPPQPSQPVRIVYNTNAPRLLFAGALQTIEESFQGAGAGRVTVYPCTAIDDTPRGNRRLPFGSWVDVSASTVVRELVAGFCPGMTARHVVDDLAPVSINLDGSEGMNGALNQLAKLVGGYWYWEDADLHFFLEETGETPDPIDDDHPFAFDPRVTGRLEDSQVRTRILGKGHGEATLAAIPAGDSIVPIANAVLFNPAGGRAISETQQIAYTGVELGGAGSLVGPGVGPASAPTVTAIDGGAIEVGTHDYAVTFTTATGESLPSPLARVTLGPIAPPTGTPTMAEQPGAGLDINWFNYRVTFVTPSGETTSNPEAPNGVHTRDVAPPAAAPTLQNTAFFSGWYMSWQAGDSLFLRITYLAAGGETVGSVNSNTVIAIPATTGATPGRDIDAPFLPVSSDPAVTQKRLYLYVNGVPHDKGTIPNSWTSRYNLVQNGSLNEADSTGPPAVSTAGFRRVQLSNIPIGPTGTTARRLYRGIVGGAPYALVTTIADNTSTNYLDATPTASLGAGLPASNTTAHRQVAINNVPIGAGPVTGRKIYRTIANGAQLKLQQTIANNTATSGANDTTVDASLGATAPAGDTSGLTQPTGQVVAGSTTLLAAGVGWARPGGGFARIGNGAQVIRYAGLSGNTLTGIPSSGDGAIIATVIYGSTITGVPMLTGVTGLVRKLLRGAPVNIWLQVDDLAAQAAAAARESTPTRPSDGITEFRIVDERRGENSLLALCLADLALYAYPIVSVSYATRDVKTKSGRPVAVDLDAPPIHQTLVIQAVDISQLNTSPGVPPKFTVQASSVRYSVEDVLRRLAGLLEGM